MAPDLIFDGKINSIFPLWFLLTIVNLFLGVFIYIHELINTLSILKKIGEKKQLMDKFLKKKINSSEFKK
jgi:hypothetical protein